MPGYERPIYEECVFVGARRTTWPDYSADKVRLGRLLGSRIWSGELAKKSPLDASIPSNKEILHSICTHRAEFCFDTLVFEVLPSGLNDALEGELYPLHFAAQSLWFYATETILECHEARADLPPDDPVKFPLTFALKSIRENTCAREWNPKMSIFKLIFVFCLPQMKEPLETVTLLASKTEQLEAISRHCVLQGETVHFAALLFVAWDKIVKPVSDQGIKGSPIGKLILSELQRYQENCVSENPDNSAEFHEYGTNLGNAWKVLQILDIARDTIHECRAQDLLSHEVPFVVESALRSDHIVLAPEDKWTGDMKCLRPQINPKQKAWLFRSIDKKVRSVSALPTPSMMRSYFSTTVASNMNSRQSANMIGNSHSFHTFLPNRYMVKPVRSQISQSSQKQKPGTFSGFLRSQGISSSMSRLFSTLKRM